MKTPNSRRNRRNIHSGRGFTLIELLLVMTILAIMAALVVPKFTGRSEQARVTAANTDISQIGLLLDAFEQDCGRYPNSQEGLQALMVAPNGVKNWHGPYFKNGMPKDPWGNDYIYVFPSPRSATDYDLSSAGADGQGGTADDITSWQK